MKGEECDDDEERGYDGCRSQYQLRTPGWEIILFVFVLRLGTLLPPTEGRF